MKILILSDIHANLNALEAVLKTEKGYDKIFFLGDIVDYGTKPAECLDFIRSNADYFVRGNHDNALGYDVECGSMGTFREYSVETRKWHQELLNKEEKEFLRQMPLSLHIEVDGYEFHLTHASPEGDIFKYLPPEEIDEKIISNINADFILIGHTHIQFSKKIGNKLVVNPGSIGLARDGGEACYALFSDGSFELKRVKYNTEKTIRELFDAPLSQKTKEGLKSVLLHK